MKNFIVTTLLCCISFCATAQKNETVEYPFFRAKNTRVFDITNRQWKKSAPPIPRPTA